MEHRFQRNPNLGYEPEGSFGYVRYLEHGVPNTLIRWHYHEEYELHYIVNTYGKVFVGDYIGRFKPGNLILTGPRLPHNWISTDMPKEGIKIRDRVIQFSDEPFRHAVDFLPELEEALPLLERAKHGVEFFGISDFAAKSLTRIQHTTGLQRFSAFLDLLAKLSTHQEYNLLSNKQLQSFDDDATLQQISKVVDYITTHYADVFTMSEVAAQFRMSQSCFSRYFQRATGRTFTNFVTHVRISRACYLLMETNQYISAVCYAVGFNNVANFNRRFKEVKGITPNEFRRQSEDKYG